MLHNRPVYAWQMLAQQFKSWLAARAAPFVRFFSAAFCRPCKCCVFAYLGWQNLDITAQQYPYSRNGIRTLHPRFPENVTDSGWAVVISLS
jgi:hypothetical protein